MGKIDVVTLATRRLASAGKTTRATDIVAGAAPWLAPIPTAWLVGGATMKYLGWPLPVAICAALIVESLGLAAADTALTLWEYNKGRRKTDPPAPFPLAAGLVLVYVVVAILLTVALDVFAELAKFAPAIWPGLSLTGVTLLALRSDHRRRLEVIAQEKADRRAQRTMHKTAQDAQIVHLGMGDTPLNGTNRKRQERRAQLLESLLAAYGNNPNLGATDAAKLLGVHRNTVYNYTGELVSAGRLNRNGNGWEAK